MLHMVRHQRFFGDRKVVKLGEGGSYYVPRFVKPEKAARDFGRLRTELSWHNVMARGKRMHRKKVAFVEHAQDGSYPLYRYPFMFNNVEPFHCVPRGYLEECQKLSPGFALNHGIATFYKDGSVTIGDHQDSPRDIAPGSLIFDVSLGAPRWFRLTSKDGKHVQEIFLQPGSLLVLDWRPGRTRCLSTRNRRSPASASSTVLFARCTIRRLAKLWNDGV